MKREIILVEDDTFLREGLNELLLREGYDVAACASCKEADRALHQGCARLAILDISLPDGNGIELCRKWRAERQGMPILFLTACDEEIQIVRGLDAGGDDYVTKPFRMLELLSRIRALLRREETVSLAERDIEVDRSRMSVRKNGEMVYVTPTEFKILSALMENSGQILTREVLLERIWDDGGQFVDGNTLSVHISRLREKVGAEHIKTIRGVGYQWEE